MTLPAEEVDPRLPVTETAFGVALLSTVVALSATYARKTPELDGSNFAMGVLAVVGLLGIAVGAQVLLPVSARRTVLTSWPGAAGVAGAGVMLSVLIKDEDWSVYSGALVGIALAVTGYLVVRSAPFVLATVAGIAVLYAQVLSDLIDTNDGDSTNTFMIIGAAIALFTVSVTVIGWRLPGTAVLTGVVVGAGSIAAMALVLQLLMFANTFGFSGPGDPDFSSGSYAEFSDAVRRSPYENDIYVVLGLCLLLAVFWSACSAVSGHVGFRILVVVDLVLTVPLTTMALSTQHPTWWEVGAAAFGGLALLAVAFRAKAEA